MHIAEVRKRLDQAVAHSRLRQAQGNRVDTEALLTAIEDYLHCLPTWVDMPASRSDIAAASHRYATDRIAIDADARCSPYDEGVWVQAWVDVEHT